MTARKPSTDAALRHARAPGTASNDRLKGKFPRRRLDYACLDLQRIYVKLAAHRICAKDLGV